MVITENNLLYRSSDIKKMIHSWNQMYWEHMDIWEHISQRVKILVDQIAYYILPFLNNKSNIHINIYTKTQENLSQTLQLLDKELRKFLSMYVSFREDIKEFYLIILVSNSYQYHRKVLREFANNIEIRLSHRQYLFQFQISVMLYSEAEQLKLIRP